MCGIIGGVARGDIAAILLEGLRRLEYRGYDSAGIAIIDEQGLMRRERAVGKVNALAEQVQASPLPGPIGIAHTRWATHGQPCTENAHPHTSNDCIAVVHNGIVENHAGMRTFLQQQGYRFDSDTDTEVIAHLVELHYRRHGDLLAAVRTAMGELEGAFTFAVVCQNEPRRLVAARQGSPLVVGIGEGQNFIASDTYALLPVANRFVYLEDGDLVDLCGPALNIYDAQGHAAQRPLREVQASAGTADKAGYRHYMQKEIFEQPTVIARTFNGWVQNGALHEEAIGEGAGALLDRVRGVHVVACGTSFHAGLVGRYWFEELGVPCAVEVASEYRYRRQIVPTGTLLVTISQSGETADTLAALRLARTLGYAATLTVCNVPSSSLVRESDHAVITRAGPEIGVASTKAFTTQLVALQLLALALARRHGADRETERRWLNALADVPERMEEMLHARLGIDELAADLAPRQHALFLGRGIQYPVAMEGALKLKEISYIHAEAYPAGELKHGPLALVDPGMQVICTLPHDHLQAKTLSNLREVQARGGRLLVFCDDRARDALDGEVHAVPLGRVEDNVAPLLFTLPLQLLAYHTAVHKGADVDQPRNLAKSVTVE